MNETTVFQAIEGALVGSGKLEQFRDFIAEAKQLRLHLVVYAMVHGKHCLGTDVGFNAEHTLAALPERLAETEKSVKPCECPRCTMAMGKPWFTKTCPECEGEGMNGGYPDEACAECNGDSTVSWYIPEPLWAAVVERAKTEKEVPA